MCNSEDKYMRSGGGEGVEIVTSYGALEGVNDDRLEGEVSGT